MTSSRIKLIMLALAAAVATGCAHHAISSSRQPVPKPPPPDKPAPDSFSVLMTTSRGPVTMMFHRDWAPHGVDRLYTLIKAHYYDKAKFYRVEPKFVVQWGLAAEPKVTAKYREAKIPDDSVRRTNARGTISFARSGPNTRTTQLFINLVNNVRLDKDSGFGFAPVGEVIIGMEAVDSFTSEYRSKVPRALQDSITKLGNPYLTREFPKMDGIIAMKVVRQWKR